MAHSPSTLQNAGRFNWSMDSTDSGVATKSSHNSCSDLSQEDTDELASYDCGNIGNSSTQATQTDSLPAEGQVMEKNKDGCYPKEMNQSLSELRSSLEKLIKNLSDRVENLEQKVQIVQSQSIVSSLSASTPNQPSCSSSCSDLPMKRETEPIPAERHDMPNLDPHSITTRENRFFSDGKIIIDRKSEIQKQVGSTKGRSRTQIDGVSNDAHAMPGSQHS